MIAPAPHRRLRELLAGLVPVEQDCDIRGLCIDSRRVQPGDLFFAWPGERVDGRGFMREAAAQGAAAIVCETNGETLPGLDVPVLALPQLRRRAGAIADRFYGAPSRQLTVVGVTGTNGKTTCTQLLAQALTVLARRCAVIGTLGYGYPGALNESLHTTPDAVTVHRLLAGFLAEGARAVAMEVSSHALDQGRVTGVHFDVAVFTNLTRDHLDYHGDMVAYGAAKATLFDWPNLKRAIVNADDAFGRELIARLGARVPAVSYGVEQGDVRATALTLARDGMHLRVTTPQGEVALHSPLFGRFNAHNLLAVLATLLALDVPLTEAAAALARARPAAGRMEHFGGSDDAPLVVVDYAHTPDALEKVLQTLREHTAAKLLCVFGCGGDRDRGKRPLMGAIAERLADTVILTDDNPRHEDGQAIIDEVRGGMQRAPRVLRDRRAAIAQALALAGPADIVLVAGKGHEDYQQVGDERRPYSDRATVRELIGATST
jgi:UDP-N-acetylmuramoyl-L-alanyl-D-glutamate--2,6-diaminopimelate ligase